jgi:acyl-coenzyme A thioesterase PaaI-like protein
MWQSQGGNMSVERHARELTAALQSGAYQRWIGAHLVCAHESSVEIIVPYRDDFEGVAGYIHPAVMSAVADVALTSLLQLIGAEARTPGGLHVEQLGRARAGNELYAHAQIVSGQAQVEIRTNDDRALVARATLSAPAHRGEISASTSAASEPQLVYPI